MLVIVLAFCLVACAQTQADPTEPSLSPEEQVLADRRDAAESYMRDILTVKWRAAGDIVYQISTGDEFKIVAGRVYCGVPYSFGYSTKTAFLEYSNEVDEKGIPVISGLTTGALNGGGSVARIGTDCISTLALAWASIGATLTHSSTAWVHSEHGYLPVGEYEIQIKDGKMVNTKADILNNGNETMYKAYAQLQKADGMVKYGGSTPYAVMVTSVDIVYDTDGNIDPKQSRVNFIEQTRNNQRGLKAVYDESLGEKVYIIGGLDKSYPFETVAKEGYLPITCKELIDPAPKDSPNFLDSEKIFNKDTIFAGVITTNWSIDTVSVAITDTSGNVLQKISASSKRYENQCFELQQFFTDDPGSIRGDVDVDALTSGDYHCTLVVRLVNGQEFTVRDFDFTV